MIETERPPLRLWPGVAIVAAQLAALYGPATLVPGTPLHFFGMMGSFTIGTLLLFIWWLFLSRARWSDRIGGLVLLIVVHGTTILLADKSAKMATSVPGIPLLCLAFVASLFFRSRAVTVVAVLLASLVWTVVRTEGVDGAMAADYDWRWNSTAEDRFMDSAASEPPPQKLSAEELEQVAAWPGFRGAGRDDVLAGSRVGTDWARNPPEQVWRRPVGPGWGSFVLIGDRLCTQEQRDENEVVVCYDSRSGEPIWLHAYPARFWEALGGVGPRATPTFHAGRLYALGATGVLNSLNAATGELVWTRNIADDTGASVPDWGFASSPLVVDDLVIVHAAGAPAGKATVAYDLSSGEPRWFGPASGPSYSSPHLATIDGVRQILMITGDGVFGLLPETGALLWEHDWPMGGGGSRVVQPALLDGGDMLIGTSFGMGTRRISVSESAGTWSVREAWTSQGLKPYYNDLVVHHGTAYGFDGSILAAIDVESGERRWKGGRYGNGQLLLLPEQDLLLVTSERGELALVRATPERFEEVGRIQAIEGKTWNHAIVVDGTIYLRNSEEAAAYRLPA